MSKEESDQGFIVLSVVLHNQILTWFIACEEKDKNHNQKIKLRQVKL